MRKLARGLSFFPLNIGLNPGDGTCFVLFPWTCSYYKAIAKGLIYSGTSSDYWVKCFLTEGTRQNIAPPFPSLIAILL